jgi:D-sedoheptulose 7-phosphate isomerase
LNPALRPVRADLLRARGLLIAAFRRGGKLLLCGNGGSASDCEHIAGELLKSFAYTRPLDGRFARRLKDTALRRKLERGFPAIPLVSFSAFLTAFGNDVDPEFAFAQLVNVLGRPGDVLLAISTSGNSRNVLYAAKTARARRVAVIGLTGRRGGKLKGLSDVAIRVPADRTPDVQELHLPCYHFLCTEVERILSHGSQKHG